MGGTAYVKIDLKGLKKKCSPEAVRRGKVAMISQMIKGMKQFIPYKDGILSDSGAPIDDGIRYPGPYARAQFYGSSYNKTKRWTFKKYNTPGTGKRWDRKATPKYAKQWGDTALKGMGIK